MDKKGYITDIIVRQDESSKLEGLVDFYYISKINGNLEINMSTVQIPHRISLNISSKHNPSILRSRFEKYKQEKTKEFNKTIADIKSKVNLGRRLTKNDKTRIELLENYKNNIENNCKIEIKEINNQYNKVILTSYNHGSTNVLNYFNHFVGMPRITDQKRNENLTFKKVVELCYGYGLKSYSFMPENSRISMHDLIDAPSCSLDIETKGWKRKYFTDVYGSLSKEEKIKFIEENEHALKDLIDFSVYSDNQINNLVDNLITEMDLEHMTSVGMWFANTNDAIIPTAFPKFSQNSLSKDPISKKIIESENHYCENDSQIVEFINEIINKFGPIIMETQNGIGFDYNKMNGLSGKKLRIGHDNSKLNITYVNRDLPTNSLTIPGRIDIDSHQIMRIFGQLPDTKLDTLFTYFMGVVEKKAFATHSELEKESIEAFDNGNKKIADRILTYNLDDLIKAHYPCYVLREDGEVFDYEKLFELPLTRIFGCRFKKAIEHFWLKKHVEQNGFLETYSYLKNKIITPKSKFNTQDQHENAKSNKKRKTKSKKKLGREIEIPDILGELTSIEFNDFSQDEFNLKLFELLKDEQISNFDEHLKSSAGIHTGYKVYLKLNSKQFEKEIREDKRMSEFYAKTSQTHDKDKLFRRNFILESVLSYRFFTILGQSIGKGDKQIYDMNYSRLFNHRIKAKDMNKKKEEMFNEYLQNFKEVVKSLDDGIINYASKFIYVSADKEKELEELVKQGLIGISEPGLILNNKKKSVLFREYNPRAETTNRITFYGFPNYKNNKGKKNKFVRSVIQPLLEDIVLGEDSKPYLEKLNMMNRNLFSFYYDKNSLSREKKREMEDILIEVIEAASDFFDASLDSYALGTVKTIEKKASKGDALEILFEYRDMMRFLYGLNIPANFEKTFHEQKTVEEWDLDEIYNYCDLFKSKGVNFHNGYVSRFFNGIINLRKFNQGNEDIGTAMIRLFHGIADKNDIEELSETFDYVMQSMEVRLDEIIEINKNKESESQMETKNKTNPTSGKTNQLSSSWSQPVLPLLRGNSDPAST